MGYASFSSDFVITAHLYTHNRNHVRAVVMFLKSGNAMEQLWYNRGSIAQVIDYISYVPADIAPIHAFLVFLSRVLYVIFSPSLWPLSHITVDETLRQND